jgi:glycosyltransferase involved in cell wall biosynthesis
MKDNLNILIISYYFAPENKIASVRMTKIAKYLKKNSPGAHIRVVTRSKESMKEDALLAGDAAYCDEILRFPSGGAGIKASVSLLKSIASVYKFLRSGGRHKHTENKRENPEKNSGAAQPVKNGKFFTFYYTLLDILQSIGFFGQVQRSLQHLTSGGVDVVISSFGPYANHWIARKVKADNPKAFWIADFRDAVVTPPVDHVPFKRFLHRYIARSCNLADILTCVSAGCLKSLNLPSGFRTAVITNGFDPDEKPAKHEVPADNKKLTITYTGSFYRGKSDAAPLFAALKELVSKGQIDKEYVRVAYAGRSSAILQQAAEQHDMSAVTKDYGLVSRPEALEIQARSHILLLASWNSSGQEGILTGKLMEYMMMGKPLIAVVSGNKARSEMRTIIERCSLGVCCEAADTASYAALKEFILKQYTEFRKTGTVIFNPTDEEIKKFRYDSIAGSIGTLISRAKLKEN